MVTYFDTSYRKSSPTPVPYPITLKVHLTVLTRINVSIFRSRSHPGSSHTKRICCLTIYPRMDVFVFAGAITCCWRRCRICMHPTYARVLHDACSVPGLLAAVVHTASLFQRHHHRLSSLLQNMWLSCTFAMLNGPYPAVLLFFCLSHVA